ncbi:uncharacterized protein CDAR_402711 [Caerostris darwini]|uniref:EGF-like domain-containing protein n=1 Tax=Caerostris darwini TaxID=1538125 RepID=A0AAV4T0E2_9ARAC|nr:uncharacterized protein CDAR_402711 [Caerostris darwini]
MNGGTCIGPNVCGCPPEYRGRQCEFYFLKCDIRKFAGGNKIRWVCTHSKNETNCKVKCEDNLAFATPSENIYKCTPDGVWTPKELPECVPPEMVTTKAPEETSKETSTTETATQETTENS